MTANPIAQKTQDFLYIRLDSMPFMGHIRHLGMSGLANPQEPKTALHRAFRLLARSWQARCHI